MVACRDKIGSMDHVHAHLYSEHSGEERHPFAVMDEAFSEVDEDLRCSAIRDIGRFFETFSITQSEKKEYLFVFYYISYRNALYVRQS